MWQPLTAAIRVPAVLVAAGPLDAIGSQAGVVALIAAAASIVAALVTYRANTGTARNQRETAFNARVDQDLDDARNAERHWREQADSWRAKCWQHEEHIQVYRRALRDAGFDPDALLRGGTRG